MITTFYKNFTPSKDLQEQVQIKLGQIENLLPYKAHTCGCFEKNESGGISFTLNALSNSGHFNASVQSSSIKDLLTKVSIELEKQLSVWREKRHLLEASTEDSIDWYNNVECQCDDSKCSSSECPFLSFEFKVRKMA